jgi:hypothetical protein
MGFWGLLWRWVFVWDKISLELDDWVVLIHYH